VDWNQGKAGRTPSWFDQVMADQFTVVGDNESAILKLVKEQPKDV
jgi:hypothetical protein